MGKSCERFYYATCTPTKSSLTTNNSLNSSVISQYFQHSLIPPSPVQSSREISVMTGGSQNQEESSEGLDLDVLGVFPRSSNSNSSFEQSLTAHSNVSSSTETTMRDSSSSDFYSQRAAAISKIRTKTPVTISLSQGFGYPKSYLIPISSPRNEISYDSHNPLIGVEHSSTQDMFIGDTFAPQSDDNNTIIHLDTHKSIQLAKTLFNSKLLLLADTLSFIRPAKTSSRQNRSKASVTNPSFIKSFRHLSTKFALSQLLHQNNLLSAENEQI